MRLLLDECIDERLRRLFRSAKTTVRALGLITTIIGV